MIWPMGHAFRAVADAKRIAQRLLPAPMSLSLSETLSTITQFSRTAPAVEDSVLKNRIAELARLHICDHLSDDTNASKDDYFRLLRMTSGKRNAEFRMAQGTEMGFPPLASLKIPRLLKLYEMARESAPHLQPALVSGVRQMFSHAIGTFPSLTPCRLESCIESMSAYPELQEAALRGLRDTSDKVRFIHYDFLDDDKAAKTPEIAKAIKTGLLKSMRTPAGEELAKKVTERAISLGNQRAYKNLVVLAREDEDVGHRVYAGIASGIGNMMGSSQFSSFYTLNQADPRLRETAATAVEKHILHPMWMYLSREKNAPMEKQCDEPNGFYAWMDKIKPHPDLHQAALKGIAAGSSGEVAIRCYEGYGRQARKEGVDAKLAEAIQTGAKNSASMRQRPLPLTQALEKPLIPANIPPSPVPRKFTTAGAGSPYRADEEHYASHAGATLDPATLSADEKNLQKFATEVVESVIFAHGSSPQAKYEILIDLHAEESRTRAVIASGVEKAFRQGMDLNIMPFIENAVSVVSYDAEMRQAALRGIASGERYFERFQQDMPHIRDIQDAGILEAISACMTKKLPAPPAFYMPPHQG